MNLITIVMVSYFLFLIISLVSQYDSVGLNILQKSKIQRIKIPASNIKMKNNLRYFPCQFNIVGDITKPYYLDIYYNSRRSSYGIQKFNNNTLEIKVENVEFKSVNKQIFNTQSSQNITVPLKISSFNGDSNGYYFGFFIENEIRRMICIETLNETICTIPTFKSLFSKWNDFKYYSLGLYFNESLVRQFTPGIHFYGKIISIFSDQYNSHA